MLHSRYCANLKNLKISEWNKLPEQTRNLLDKEYEEVRARYSHLLEIIQSSPMDSSCLDDEDFSFEIFKWAFWILRSRWIDCIDSTSAANRLRKGLKWLKIGSSNDFGALCPYFDLINHSQNNFNVEYWFNDKSKSLHVRTIKPVRKGSQILEFYVKKTDDEYILDYGQAFLNFISTFSSKLGCVFPMVIRPAFRIGQYRVNDHPYHQPQFRTLLMKA